MEFDPHFLVYDEAECPDCGGTGDCPRCDGRGCAWCSGTGECPECGGEGIVEAR
jgi:hypothetical protein